MPAAFDECVKAGGRVITQTLPEGRYLHICYDTAGQAHAGHVKKRKRDADHSDDLRTFSFHTIARRR